MVRSMEFVSITVFQLILGLAIFKDSRNGLTVISEYKNDKQHGKTTYYTRLSRFGDEEIENCTHDNGEQTSSMIVTETPELAFFTKDGKYNKALDEDYLNTLLKKN